MGKLRAHLPWVAVATGAYLLFAYGVVGSIPSPIRQAYGAEVLLFASKEALTSFAFAALLGRLLVLLGRPILYTALRDLTMQLPLLVLSPLPKRIRGKSRRFVVRYRRWVDLIIAVAIASPNAFSIAVGTIIFVYWQNGNWPVVIALILALLLVFFSWVMVQEEQNSRIRFRYSSVFEDLSELRSVSYSTAVLLIAFFVGSSQATSMLQDAPVVVVEAQNVSIFYLSDRHVVFTWENDEKQRLWKVAPIDLIGDVEIGVVAGD